MEMEMTNTLPQRLLEDQEQDGPDNKEIVNMFSVVMSNLLLFFLIFGLSATVQIKTLRHQLTNKFAIFTGVAMQFMIMPALGFLSVYLLRGSGFSRAMGISLLVVTASPGGSYSNWWCSVFNAELALSVAMTSVSSILSIGLLPANLFLYTWLAYTVVEHSDGEMDAIKVWDAIDFGAIFLSLGVVMGAILLGLFAGYKYDNAVFHKRANGFGSFCGISLILFSVFLSSGTGEAETNIFALPWSFYIGVAFPCIVGMTLANLLSRTFRLSPPECVAISIECCYQNTAIATSVAVTMFQDPNERAEAISVPLFYGVVEAFLIGAYCVWAWKMGWTKAPAHEHLCVVVTKTYEVEDDPHARDNPSFGRNGNLQNTEKSKGFWGNVFSPRSSESAKELPMTQTPSKHVDRARFNSVDETLATAAVSPPNTPDLPHHSKVFDRRSGNRSGLENIKAPAMTPPRSVIEVIREDVEGHSDSLQLKVPPTRPFLGGDKHEGDSSTPDNYAHRSESAESQTPNASNLQVSNKGFEAVLRDEESSS